MDYKTRYVFVDESGDTAMFDKKHRPLTDVSKLFMIGLAIIDDPLTVRNALNDLRIKLLCDPYFAGVPSFQPEQKKTALMFHAKDDIPEVRWSVFELLKTIPAKATIVVRRKQDIMQDAQDIFHKTGNKLTDDIIYDNIVATLFKYVSHKNGDYDVKFAVKKKPRNLALLQAIHNAQNNLRQSGSKITTNIKVISDYSQNDACLQLIDYYMWAIHRFYINKEIRYLNMVKDNISVIYDVDDKRNLQTGVLYTRHNPISIAKTKPVQ